ncbi:hypothetical protein [Corynebacterium sp.]|uniref:hypothetical protein n=1 Tax=Corynebacterium sp. TaxID=1720 RepID=UPI0028B127D0|nr:hypothetical protein [Corynebacterium sp.]
MGNMDRIRDRASDLADQLDVVHGLEELGMQGSAAHVDSVKKLRQINGKLKRELALSNPGRKA